MTASKPRRSPKPQERQRDPERTRRLILEAAAAEFAAKGYAGARIAAIAARAGVNQQLISYYFDGKEGLYRAMSEGWGQRQSELMAPDLPLSEQVRRMALETVESRDGVRLLAWSGLEYEGPETDPDHAPRTQRLTGTVERLGALKAEGRLPDWADPECLTVLLMAAAMAPVTLPHVVDGLTGTQADSPEFVRRYADQLASLIEHLESTGP
ncbi:MULTISPECIES: TetR family transcriptional regulator [unclassified Amycolatopsis]|uniref:TetR/AcrR family transcriptional regulator n=1 Tax=unclassified Amycolatopsis TaxID=2618356 RepID=UPI002876E7B5|nr:MULTISPECIES: TetR family transcriptional regulator [unclassified Amycolatopsis]MDS0133574.1 TetR family transcriptional regulator [Amycolatopsis sp. 505]MDS0148581.1 TetR family transcriptional regulator [Amycolatopsis sp. CM201R]